MMRKVKKSSFRPLSLISGASEEIGSPLATGGLGRFCVVGTFGLTNRRRDAANAVTMIAAMTVTTI